MKLYVLTSTLNFHSILATESCSPSICYAHRGFGDSYFYVAGSFAKKNSIILFSKYPKCSMPITEEEQYSLVIEIDTEKTANFSYEEVGKSNGVIIYQTNKTIYLNPMGSKFLFETTAIRDLIISRAKVRSLDAKMLFYSVAGCFSVSCAEHFVYGKEYVEAYSDVEFDKENLYRDQKINKCKGFLYAYLLGANTSPGNGIASLQQILKELSNLIHARVINNEYNLHTDRIDDLQAQFVAIAHTYDLVFQKVTEAANQLNGSSTEKLRQVLVDLGVWDSLACKMFSLPKLALINSLETLNSVEGKMANFIKQASSRENNKILIDEIPSIHEFQPALIPLSSSEQEIQIYTEWIKILLNPECNLKTFFANRLSYLKKLGIIAREIIGKEEFANSPERTFYNGLIKNIREAENFELSSFNSLIWQSLAMCAKVTNSDIEALYSLMTSSGIEDYRCAVAMWGAMCGYADMPKTFFDRITEGVSISEAYEYVICITKKLLEFDIDELKLVGNHTDISNATLDKNDDNISTKQQIEEIWNFFNSIPPKNGKKKDKLKEGLHLCLQRNNDMVDLSQFVFDLNDFDEYGWSKNNKPWKAMQEKFCPDYKDKVGQKKKNQKISVYATPSLFDTEKDRVENAIQAVKGINSPVGNEPKAKESRTICQQDFSTLKRETLFVLDRDCWNYLQKLIPTSLRHNFNKDLTWFQDEYAKGEKSQYYAKASRENSSTIEAFLRYIRKKKYAESLDIELISKYLHNTYGR